MMSEETDKIIWYMMSGAMAIVILIGSAWAKNVNDKIEKIATMETNIQYIQQDISSIKGLMQNYIKRGR